MNEDDSARREFVFGLFLTTVLAPLLAGLTAFAAGVGAVYLSDGLSRLRGRHRDRQADQVPLSAPRMATHRAVRRADNRHARRALANRRPGGVLH
ncbi:hypothetical protein GPX89_06550 [Nocardia sp. ET3-3]|uniref:Uncharacterized protein n=1 Tax=Nocardia terrae TaxID=2675851 RepID=A0A7K1URC8_9NOCA|nr:hypothetical protein [Nocardia terrae]MVU76903.1 hypothetical protein [Nocardia terrae]